MSTAVALANVKVPAHIAARMGAPSALADALQGGMGSGGGPRISVKGSRFRIVADGVETVLPDLHLDVAIVGANPHVSKMFYIKQWEPGDAEAPDCSSDDGIAPSSAAPDPQSDRCATCPQNEWGSKITPQGKEVKACQDTKRLAVVAADDPEGDLYALAITPSAFKDFTAYQRELAMRNIPPEVVRTRISFDTDASYPKLKFAFNGFHSEEVQISIDKLLNSEAVRMTTGEKTRVKELAAPVAKAIAKPAPKAAPVEEPEAPAAAPAAKGFGSKKKAAPVEEAEAPAAAPAAKGFGSKAATEAKPTVIVADASDIESAVDDLLKGLDG